MASKRVHYWIAGTKVRKHKGRLHRRLGIPEGEKIPVRLLRRAVHAGGTLGHEALFALNARHFKHHRGKKRVSHRSTR